MKEILTTEFLKFMVEFLLSKKENTILLMKFLFFTKDGFHEINFIYIKHEQFGDIHGWSQIQIYEKKFPKTYECLYGTKIDSYIFTDNLESIFQNKKMEIQYFKPPNRVQVFKDLNYTISSSEKDNFIIDLEKEI